MIPLGEITHLQVQIGNLKVGSGKDQQYDNRLLRPVPALAVESGGVWGITGSGERLPDIHHRDHPQTKLRGNVNPISFGFTGHYDAMRSEFGNHLVDGSAGENILIDVDQIVGLLDVVNGLWIEQASGELVHLDGVSVAAPCAPFSRWALQFPAGERPDERVTQALQFLSSGVRGFYCRLDGPDARVSVGDMVYLSV